MLKVKNTPNSTIYYHLKRLSIAASILTVSSCANQNTIAQQQLEPVSNPCQKIDLLMNAYQSNFEQLKETSVKARVSNIWQAKYHLIGENCKIWSWGGNQTTYSCNTTEVDEATARDYFNGAKETLKKCLGKDWQLAESKRKNDDGLKAEYTTKNNPLSLSTHLVPNSGLFQSKWSVYYYIGRTK